MTFNRLLTSLAAVAVTAAAACVTVNIYFPAPEIRQAAEDIVEETWGSDAGACLTPAGAPAGAGARALAALAAWFGPRQAHAADPDINVSTAAIRALKDAMRERSAVLKPYLNSGAIGIGADGMLKIRDLAQLSLKDKAMVRRELEAENGDRMSLYREIASANDLGEDRVKDIQAIFAETWSAKAEKGWWIEAAGGKWAQR